MRLRSLYRCADVQRSGSGVVGSHTAVSDLVGPLSAVPPAEFVVTSRVSYPASAGAPNYHRSPARIGSPRATNDVDTRGLDLEGAGTGMGDWTKLPTVTS